MLKTLMASRVSKSFSWFSSAAADCWEQENNPARQLSHARSLRSQRANSDAEEGHKARWCLLPALPSQAARLPQVPQVFLPLQHCPSSPREEKFSFAWTDDPVRHGDLWPLQALRQSPASCPHHSPHHFPDTLCVQQALAPLGLSGQTSRHP